MTKLKLAEIKKYRTIKYQVFGYKFIISNGVIAYGKIKDLEKIIGLKME